MASEAAARLLDLSQPIDVPLLDATVAAFYGAGSKEEVGVMVPLWDCFCPAQCTALHGFAIECC